MVWWLIFFVCVCVWRLILCVSLTELSYAQKAGKIPFLDVSMRVSPEDINIGINKLSKEIHPHQCRWAASNHLRAWIEQKGRRRGIFSLCMNWDIHPLPLPLFIGASGSPVWTQTRTYTIGSLVGSGPFRLRLNYTTSFPCFLSYREQIRGPLRLHNHMSQFLR